DPVGQSDRLDDLVVVLRRDVDPGRFLELLEDGRRELLVERAVDHDLALLLRAAGGRERRSGGEEGDEREQRGAAGGAGGGEAGHGGALFQWSFAPPSGRWPSGTPGAAESRISLGTGWEAK